MVASLGHYSSGDVRPLASHRADERHRGFYHFYHIDVEDHEANSDDTDGGSQERGEVTGLHSPFGITGKLRRELQLSLHQIMWREIWIELLLESADQPRYTAKQNKVQEISSVDELQNLLKR